jgi:hypothetical protein
MEIILKDNDYLAVKEAALAFIKLAERLGYIVEITMTRENRTND